MKPTEHHALHSRVVAAPVDVLFDLIGNVTLWPALFGPSVYVRHLDRTESTERFRLWATVNGAVVDWTSRRELDRVGRRIAFQQEVSRPPVASMGGEWQFRELVDGRTEVVLRHRFTVVDDDPESVTLLNEALDRNSEAELGALARVAEFGLPVANIAFTFTDEMKIAGRAADAYEFVARADRWAERLPHVARVRLIEETPGIQDLSMDTLTADGSKHTTRSIRVCAEPSWIAYKQTLPPALLLGHSGLWTFTDKADHAVLTAQHTVLINPDAVTDVLGPGKDLADARAFIRQALGRNSATTMEHAAAHAPAPRQV